MIKEKQKITKYNISKTIKQIFIEYVRTIVLSIIAAAVVTAILTYNARNEMIKNIYVNVEEQKAVDKQKAMELLKSSDLVNDLENKNFAICMDVGELYETAGNIEKAIEAYEFAVKKSKQNNYKAYYKLECALLKKDNFDKAEALLENVKDYNNKNLIKFKTRGYIVLGDKYYSVGKFLSAAKSYETSYFYYNKLKKRDKKIVESLINRIVNSYVQVGDIMVKSGMNSDAIRFLSKASKYKPENLIIKYKIAVVLSDLDPEKAVNEFELLLNKIPQNIDYGIYSTALMKAANIADLDNRSTQAKYYRYKIHSLDLFVKNKVIYKNDIETTLEKISNKKVFFTYPLKIKYKFTNVSNSDIKKLYADFVLKEDDKIQEVYKTEVSNSENPLSSNSTPISIDVNFKKNIFTKKELNNYVVEVYLYKDSKFKTLVYMNRVISNSIE